jgi:iron-sulfur cluster repair protein YtfE (RIC family)
MNALQLLKKDHDAVKQLFKRFESSHNESEHRRLAQTIKSEIQAHCHIEETIFYPALEDTDDEDLAELVDQSLAEHQDILMLLEEIDQLNHAGKDLRTKIRELKQKVEKHVSEEEDAMFTSVHEFINEAELARIGEELESEKKSYSSMAA